MSGRNDEASSLSPDFFQSGPEQSAVMDGTTLDG